MRPLPWHFLSRWIVLAAVLALGAWAAARALAPPAFSREELAVIIELGSLPPPPIDPSNRFSGNAAAARLGRRIFFDPRFSKNRRVSCATCHDPARGWSNGERFGTGIGRTTRNVPTLWNTAYQRWYFWDGRADSPWAQAVQPLLGPLEHGLDRETLLERLREDRGTAAEYRAVFGSWPGGPSSTWETGQYQQAGVWPHPGAPGGEGAETLVNVAKALAAFEREIVSGQSDFDKFVSELRGGSRGEPGAFSSAARRGLKVFLGKGQCTLCHSGPNFTDGEFHNLGLPQDVTRPPDPGRYQGIEALRRDPHDRAGAFSDLAPGGVVVLPVVRGTETFGQFKTPTLRNVALTAPYMHDGQFAALEDVLEFYSTRRNATPLGHHEEGVLKPLRLSPREVRDLAAFLRSLTDTSSLARLRPPNEPGG